MFLRGCSDPTYTKYGAPEANTRCDWRRPSSVVGTKEASAALGNTRMSWASNPYVDAKSWRLYSDTVPSNVACRA